MDHSEHFKHFHSIEKEAVKNFPTTGWIQWKGTDVCIDIHCKCGHHSHLDTDFMYYFQCSNCKTIYWSHATIAFSEVTGEHLDLVLKECDGCIHTESNPQEDFKNALTIWPSRFLPKPN